MDRTTRITTPPHALPTHTYHLLRTTPPCPIPHATPVTLRVHRTGMPGIHTPTTTHSATTLSAIYIFFCYFTTFATPSDVRSDRRRHISPAPAWPTKWPSNPYSCLGQMGDATQLPREGGAWHGLTTGRVTPKAACAPQPIPAPPSFNYVGSQGGGRCAFPTTCLPPATPCHHYLPLPPILPCLPDGCVNYLGGQVGGRVACLPLRWGAGPAPTPAHLPQFCHLATEGAQPDIFKHMEGWGGEGCRQKKPCPTWAGSMDWQPPHLDPGGGWAGGTGRDYS